ncbi:hypothetical protein VQ7734_03399 [Vibrio quintilis]|uniref:Uncharacterized protein n=1 Tax=Vibrio quintilis TaxID=1117707 RepID=A0A1M7YY68_9VIBR|nr:hypothetical protein VQ7734_03399 [Vibrio quintilis]
MKQGHACPCFVVKVSPDDGLAVNFTAVPLCLQQR